MPGNVLSYSTASLNKRQRVDYWNGWISNTFTSLEARPTSDGFNGVLHKTQLADLSIAEAVSEPASVVHTRVSQASEAVFLLHLQVRGESVNRQYGRESRIREGGFTLCHSAAPYELNFSRENDMLVLRLPAQLVKGVLPHAEDLVCIGVDGTRGIGAITSSFICSLWNSLSNWPDEEAAPALQKNLLDLLAATYRQSAHTRVNVHSLINARRLQIKNYIESHLEDEELTPQHIAARFDISCTWLHKLFKGEGESVSHYILRRRLQEAGKQLVDPALTHRDISWIAFSCGFKNMSHFSRVFREHYAQSPSEYREQHIPVCS